VAYNATSLADVPILLSYSVNEGNSWNNLTTVSTDSTGSFSAEWLPPATGTYLLKGTFSGNANYSKASAIVNFAIAPFKQESTFSVTSNSTLSALAFNSTSNQISFTVSGPSATTGYVNIGIPKSLIADISKLQLFLDGTQISYSVQQQPDLWMVSFAYQHSSHQIIIDLSSAMPHSSSGGKLLEQWFVYVIIAATVVSIIAISLISLKRKQKSKPKTK